MRVVVFCHSLVSDWNHGNAHFLRGVARELIARGHEVEAYEPGGGWSRENLVRDQGTRPLDEFRAAFPELGSTAYDPRTLDLDAALDGADLVLVHEWNDPQLVRRVGLRRARGGSFRLLFHDTHHRSVTAPGEMRRFDLTHYDGVLAFGGVIRDLYLRRGWAAAAWTWHEAADTRLFRPQPARPAADLIWIGNWGDGERTAELHEFLVEPARALGLSGSVFGVRYPAGARAAIAETQLAYRGWIANYRVPRAFAGHRATVHIPRRPYARALPGIPTIRPFEALACGIPLVSSPWDDVEGLFSAGEDYLVARNGAEMTRQLGRVLRDHELARRLAEHGRRTILARHTCAHRVDELLAIVQGLGVDASPSQPTEAVS
jgi:spore maturation protein CgeB